MILPKAKGWDEFLKLCHEASSVSQLNELFDLLFTLEEKEQLAMRVRLVKELLKGEKTQREMAHDLNVSIAKITRGSNALKTADSELKAYISQLLN